MRNALARRVVESELLDELDRADPRARRSRRDLARINAIMFQPSIMASLLRRHLKAVPPKVLEIGAGDGNFMHSVARRLGGDWAGTDLVLLDRSDLVTVRQLARFRALGWNVRPVVADVFDWLESPGIGTFDVVCVNLMLHHLTTDALDRLFRRLVAVAPVLLATEPRRNMVSLAACSVLGLIGVNEVTKHDARASVRAGFRGSDLAILWPGEAAGTLERRVGPFTHTFVGSAGR